MTPQQPLTNAAVLRAEAQFCYLGRALWQHVDKAEIARDRFRNLNQELAEHLYPMAQATRSTPEFVKMLCARFEIAALGRGYVKADGSPGQMRHVMVRILPEFLPDGVVSDTSHRDASTELAVVRFDILARAIRFDALRMALFKGAQAIAAWMTGFPMDGEELAFRDEADDVAGAHVSGAMPENLHHTREYVSTWTALGPFSHGADHKSGNVTMFRRHITVDPKTGKLSLVPFYSGNAFRGMARDLVFNDMFLRLGMKPEQGDPATVHALLAGGTKSAGADGGGVDLAARRRARKCPAWDLLAGCIEEQIMKGVLRVCDSMLVCRENAWILYHLMEPKLGDGEAMPYEQFVGGLKVADDLLTLRLETRQAHRDLEGSDGSQMLVNVEHVLKGAQFVHRLSLASADTVEPLTKSCLSHLLSLFRDDPFFGSKGAHGFGQVAFTPYVARGGAAELPSPQMYLDYLAEHAEELRAWVGYVADRVKAGETTAAPAAEGSTGDKPKKKGGRGAKKEPAEGPALFEAAGV